MVRVLELSQTAFEAACRRLAGQAANVEPTVLVGIHTGGAVVAEQIKLSFPDHAHFTLSASRIGTGIKKGLKAQTILRHLPTATNNALRITEHYLREWRYECNGRQISFRNVVLEPALLEWLSHNPNGRILLIDDAVDSGATFASAIAAIHQQQPKAQIVTAAITQTFRNPIVAPQVVLYRDTLVRFPWSLDTS